MPVANTLYDKCHIYLDIRENATTEYQFLWFQDINYAVVFFIQLSLELSE